MKPLILTFFILLCLATLVVSKSKSFMNEALKNILYENYVHAHAYAERIKQETRFEEIKSVSSKEPTPTEKEERPKPTRSERRSASLNFDTARPPNNARVNFNLLPMRDQKILSTYEIAARLLRRLYSQHPDCAHLEYEILNAIIACETEDLCFPDKLAEFVFENPKIQKALSFMLRGGFDDAGNRYPSLLFYIDFSKGKKINLMFAPQELLEAVFENSALVAKIIAAREELMDKMMYEEENRSILPKEDCLTRTAIQNKQKDYLARILKEYGVSSDYALLFDFSLSAPGTILIVEDDHGVKIREKLPQGLPQGSG